MKFEYLNIRQNLLVSFMIFLLMLQFLNSADNNNKLLSEENEGIDNKKPGIGIQAEDPPSYSQATAGITNKTDNIHSSNNIKNSQSSNNRNINGNAQQKRVRNNDYSPIPFQQVFSRSTDTPRLKKVHDTAAEGLLPEENIQTHVFQDTICDQIKKIVQVKFVIEKSKVSASFGIMSNKTKDTLIENMKLITLNFGDFEIFKLERTSKSDVYYHYKKRTNNSKKEKEMVEVNLISNLIKDDLTGDMIEDKKIYVIYFDRIKLSVDELMKLKKIVAKNNDLKNIFSNVRFSITCDSRKKYLQCLDELEKSYVDIRKYKIDGYSNNKLYEELFFIEGDGADYYVNKSTLYGLFEDAKKVTKKEIKFHNEKIIRYKEYIINLLSRYASRNLIIYLYKNIIHCEFKSYDTQAEQEPYKENEVYRLYSEYLEKLSITLNKRGGFIDSLKLKKNENKVNWEDVDQKKINHFSLQHYSEKKSKTSSVDLIEEIEKFDKVAKDITVFLYTFFDKTLVYDQMTPYYERDEIEPLIDICKGKKPAESLENYFQNKKNDLNFEESIKNLCQNFLSKIEEEADRFLSIQKKINLISLIIKRKKNRYTLFKLEDYNFKKAPIIVNDNTKKVENILRFLFYALELFENKIQAGFNKDFYEKEIEKLNPALEEFEILKTKIDNIYSQKTNVLKDGDKTVYYQHPKTKKISVINNDFNINKRLEFEDQLIKSRKAAGENEWIYFLSYGESHDLYKVFE